MTPGRIGKLYTIKSWQQCEEEGVDFLPLPHGSARHMVVVTSPPDMQRNVKYVTVVTLSNIPFVCWSMLIFIDHVKSIR
jgi:hypothetical protein